MKCSNTACMIFLVEYFCSINCLYILFSKGWKWKCKILRSNSSVAGRSSSVGCEGVSVGE